MPRRRVLTDAQLESLIALPRTQPDLIRHWTLDEADLAAIARRRGGGNRLGYALQLCSFRYPGRLLRPGEVLPQPALDFVAEQIHVTPGELATYVMALAIGDGRARNQGRFLLTLSDTGRALVLTLFDPGPAIGAPCSQSERPAHAFRHWREPSLLIGAQGVSLLWTSSTI